MEKLLLPRPLPEPERHRADVLPVERLSARDDALRQKRHKFPRRRLHRSCRQLLVMSFDPSICRPGRRVGVFSMFHHVSSCNAVKPCRWRGSRSKLWFQAPARRRGSRHGLCSPPSEGPTPNERKATADGQNINKSKYCNVTRRLPMIRRRCPGAAVTNERKSPLAQEAETAKRNGREEFYGSGSS